MRALAGIVEDRAMVGLMVGEASESVVIVLLNAEEPSTVLSGVGHRCNQQHRG
jgi:hypothetical protein